ncbi:MAG: SHOCT domain-containing protein [Phycisphaerales bacterium]|nr:SHOCT domain-containing protein [Phycisphaerales bacterium]
MLVHVTSRGSGIGSNLRTRGLISDEEFAQQKARLLR